MKKSYFTSIVLLICFLQELRSQISYIDSLDRFLAEYVSSHEVVKGNDKKRLAFFPINKNFRVESIVERVKDGRWFSMETSGINKQTYRVYAILSFSINDTLVKLNLYQSQRLMVMDEYKNHLFLPFTDRTSGFNTYETGRYIDFEIEDIKNSRLVIDFNKAYNPYCAYVDGVYNCPIPPKENYLPVAITAGEMKYKK